MPEVYVHSAVCGLHGKPIFAVFILPQFPRFCTATWQNAGKVLAVGADGEVAPGDPSGGVRKGTITLSAQWDGGGPYTQRVTVPGIPVTAASKVDLQPGMAEIEQLAGDGVAALYVENSNAVLTAYAAGAAPSSTMTLQCTVTEVSA